MKRLLNKIRQITADDIEYSLIFAGFLGVILALLSTLALLWGVI